MLAAIIKDHEVPSIRRAFHLSGSALCLVAAVACSATNDSEDMDLPEDGSTDGTTDVPGGNDTESEPSATAPDLSASSEACFSVQTMNEETSYGLWSHDSAARLLTRLAVNDDGTPAKAVNAVGDIFYWKLDAAGYVVMWANTVGLGTMSRTDTTRDEHWNVVSVRDSYNVPFDVNAPYDLSRFGLGYLYHWSDYANEYDGQGLLTRQIPILDDPATPQGEPVEDETLATRFEHDAQGRCSSITRYTNRVDRFEYDEEGKLARRVVTDAFRDNFDGRFDSIVTYARDDRGRLTSVMETYEGSDTPIPRLELTYAEDGRVIEERQIDPSLGYDDGFRHTVWSPGCADILQLMIREPSLECHTGRGSSAGDFWVP